MAVRHLLAAIAVALMPLVGACRKEASGPPAAAYPVRGIDVSVHNGIIDFDAVRDAGISFVFIKASEGTDWQDRHLTRNYAGARRAGLDVGLYHFFRFESPGELQALNIIDAASMRPVDFPLIIDLEEFGNPRFTPTRHVLERLDTCLAVLRRNRIPVMLYTNKRGYQRFVAGRYDTIPLWLCSLDEGSPGDIRWTVWQHSHRGRVPGIEGPVDLDVFAGDSAAYAAFRLPRRLKPMKR